MKSEGAKSNKNTATGKAGRISKIAVTAATVAVLFAVWEIAARAVNSEYILPTVTQTFSAAIKLFGTAEFYAALSGTLGRTCAAFAISFVLAYLLAFAAEKSAVAKNIISVIIAIIRVLPTVAVILLVLFWTSSDIAPIIVTSTVVLPATYGAATEALDVVDEDALMCCKAFGVSAKDVFFKVKLPQIAPSLCRSAGRGLSLNLKLMVAAEVLAATAKSIGNMMNDGNYYLEIPKLFALVISVIVAGLIVELVFSALAKRAERWK